MSQIEVSLYDQTAVFTETPDIFSGDIDVDTVKFTFDSSWNVYNKKTAIFYNDPKKSYPVFLDDTNTAVIPSAVIDRGTKLYFGVIGTNSNGNVKTSSILSYRIERGAISADTEIPSSSAEIWLQILLNYEIALKKLQDMSNNLENMNNTLEELDQRFIDAGVENKVNLDFSNVDRVPMVDNIPVDLADMYNRQVIGYDEENNKLIPINVVARTQTVLPSSETPPIYEAIEIMNCAENSGATYPKHILNTSSSASNPAIISYRFIKPFMLSEFTKIAVKGYWNIEGRFIFSKKSDFSTIDAEYVFPITTVSEVKCDFDITSLQGNYYIKFILKGRYASNFTFMQLSSFIIS